MYIDTLCTTVISIPMKYCSICQAPCRQRGDDKERGILLCKKHHPRHQESLAGSQRKYAETEHGKMVREMARVAYRLKCKERKKQLAEASQGDLVECN